jgi:hypothetical protein
MNPGQLHDVSLARYITRAEAMLDAYIGFDQKQGGGFEPHIIGVYQQTFDYRTRRIRFPVPPVPIRQILRFRIQISNATNGVPLVATISPNDMVINEYGGYVEAVPLTAVTFAIAPVIAQLGLTEPILQMDCEVGFYEISLGEQLINLGDGKTFQAQRGYWATTYTQATHVQPNTLPPIPANVYVNGSLQTTGYTLNTTEGQVIFTTAQTGTITADYTYVIPDNVREAVIAQVEYLLAQRRLNLNGMAGLEVVRSGDQQVKRHIRQSGGANTLDAEEISARAQRLLAGYRGIPIA